MTVLVEAFDIVQVLVSTDVDILESYIILDIIQIRQVAVSGIQDSQKAAVVKPLQSGD